MIRVGSNKSDLTLREARQGPHSTLFRGLSYAPPQVLQSPTTPSSLFPDTCLANNLSASGKRRSFRRTSGLPSNQSTPPLPTGTLPPFLLGPQDNHAPYPWIPCSPPTFRAPLFPLSLTAPFFIPNRKEQISICRSSIQRAKAPNSDHHPFLHPPLAHLHSFHPCSLQELPTDCRLGSLPKLHH